MTTYEEFSLYVNIAIALSTFLAVLVALFGENIRRRLFGPRLVLKLEKPAFTTTNAGQDGWYYLIAVSNKRRSSPAKNVRLLLTNVSKKRPDGMWGEVKFSGPSQVLWRWPAHMPQYLTVGPEENATFATLLEGTPLRLKLYHRPNNLFEFIKPDDPVRLTFKAVSDAAESEYLTVELAWDGTFSEGVDCNVVHKGQI